MIDTQDKLQASINFLIPVLRIIDRYAYEEDLSRAQAVNRMVKEFILRHNLDPENTLGWKK